MSERNFLIPESLLKQLMNYLMTRPCGEVLHGVLALQQLQPEEAPTDSD